MIGDILTGQKEDRAPTPEEQGKDPAAVALGLRPWPRETVPLPTGAMIIREEWHVLSRSPVSKWHFSRNYFRQLPPEMIRVGGCHREAHNRLGVHYSRGDVCRRDGVPDSAGERVRRTARCRRADIVPRLRKALGHLGKTIR